MFFRPCIRPTASAPPPIPSGWVQTGERWALWYNGRETANVTRDGDPGEHVIAEPRFDLCAVLWNPVALRQSFPRNDLERVGAQLRPNHGRRLFRLGRIYPTRQQLPRVVSSLSGESQGHVRIDAQGEPFLPSAEALLEPPPTAVLGEMSR